MLVLALIFLFAPLVSRSPDYASGDRGRTIGSTGQAARVPESFCLPSQLTPWSIHPSRSKHRLLFKGSKKEEQTENAALTGGRAAFWMGWGNESTSPLPKPLHSLIISAITLFRIICSPSYLPLQPPMSPDEHLRCHATSQFVSCSRRQLQLSIPV